ncbi:hypothetical protein BDY17DRAFT_135210 [Neohortaea acidophila]|uniref:Transcription factor domain-containing protein n=1 Tax=Neohortaea acidophila TaxID=245834 RepID=A0A6A6PYB6_9PEZI|nr:uncharacterized protein BDY17DRAFT_135210 [Neohortaea acidophila]KAF2484766.1 hypothetical protein BDY17DRAFT_135210 [Neohortaea acidophila]
MEIPPTSAVLISTLETICFSHLSYVSRNPRYTCQSYISYAQTLKLLQAALARGPLVVDMVRRRELLTSIVLLAQLPDSITNNQAVHESWRVHLWAAIEYAAASAPAVLDFDHPLEAKLMHSIQVNGTLLAISRRTALPVHPRWLENKRLWYQGVTRPFFHVPSALEKADAALCKEDNALDIEILSHELEQLRLETELGEQPWQSARKLTKLEDVDLDQDIEEHAAVTSLATFDNLYVFTEFVAARRFTTTSQLMLVIECTLLRLLHSARDAGTPIPTSRTIEQIENNAFRLASNICMTSHHISRMQTIGNAMLVQLGLSMARQFFEEHGDQAQMEWCDACLAANGRRLVRIEAALPPSRCRINAIIPGWVAACKYQTSGLRIEAGEAGD